MMLNGELEVERYCEEIIDGNKAVKRIHGDDKYGRHIFDDDRKGGKRVHEKDKGSGDDDRRFLCSFEESR